MEWNKAVPGENVLKREAFPAKEQTKAILSGGEQYGWPANAGSLLWGHSAEWPDGGNPHVRSQRRAGRPRGLLATHLGGDNADLSCSSAINSSRMICAEFSREIALEVFENDVVALGKQHGHAFEIDVRFFKRLPRARNFR